MHGVQKGAIWCSRVGVLIVSAALLGCASDPHRVADPRDPLEPFNRAVYSFNTKVDKAVIKPVAKGYRAITPAPVDRGITNFFANLADVRSAANNILQFKMARAGSDVGRVFINSTVGALGFIDVATNVGLPSYKEDFGQTLGYWGLKPGAFVMLPLLGPSTMRDNLGRVGDLFTDPLHYVDHDGVRWGLIGLRATDRRADLLAASEILDDAALDSYAFLRDAYFQRRESLVHDGDPPINGGATDGSGDFWDTIDFETGGANATP